MAKLNITIGKGEGCMNATTAKAVMRARIYEVIAAALRAEFGEDAVEWLRTPVSPTRDENVLGVKPADISEDGGVFDGMFTLGLTAKEWADRVGTKATKAAFDWDTYAQKYAQWAEAEAVKQAEKEKTAREKAEKEAAAKAKNATKSKAKTATPPVETVENSDAETDN